jgi:hypothetical protein
MSKLATKSNVDRVPKDALTGDFLVAKLAVGPKRFTLAQIRAAVRSVNKKQLAAKNK